MSLKIDPIWGRRVAETCSGGVHHVWLALSKIALQNAKGTPSSSGLLLVLG